MGTEIFEVNMANRQCPLLVQIWYPAEISPEARRAPWLSDPRLAPGFPLNRISGARSGAFEKVKALAGAPTGWRVIFYEHAWMGHRGENLVEVEDLASEGFVVVAIDHPGQARRIVHADGRVESGTLPGVPDFSTAAAVAEFELEAEGFLSLRHEELARVRMELQEGRVRRLRDLLDLKHVGIFGFSFGGTTAIRECRAGNGFQAGANLDGFFLGHSPPLNSLLFMDEAMPGWLLGPPTSGETAEQALIRRSESRIQQALLTRGNERLIVEGTRHESFSDQLYVSAIPRLVRAGSRPADEVHQLIHQRLSGFFKQSLAAE